MKSTNRSSRLTSKIRDNPFAPWVALTLMALIFAHLAIAVASPKSASVASATLGKSVSELTQAELAANWGVRTGELTGFFSQRLLEEQISVVCWYNQTESSNATPTVYREDFATYQLRDNAQGLGNMVRVVIVPGSQAATDFDRQWNDGLSSEEVTIFGTVQQIADGEWIIYVHNAWLSNSRPPAKG